MSDSMQYRCQCSAIYFLDYGSRKGCPNCGAMPSNVKPPTALIVACPTYYLQYRGRGQEVDTYHLEEAPNKDENKRFSASFYHTPLDAKPTIVHGNSPETVLAAAKYEIEHAAWDVHYRQAIDRCTKNEARIEELEKELASLKAQPPQPASP